MNKEEAELIMEVMRIIRQDIAFIDNIIGLCSGDTETQNIVILREALRRKIKLNRELDIIAEKTEKIK